MSGTTDRDLLTIFDTAKTTPRYWASLTLLVLQEMFEYFDFFIVGYLVAVLAPQWHLTYGQSTLMLLGAGLGAVAGALLFGRLADIWGRKPGLVFCAFLIAVSAGGIALIPDDAWIIFSVLRILVGFGLGGAMAAQQALIVEFTPTRHRTLISSLAIMPVSLGIFLAAILSAKLLPVIGWRGLAALGSFPALIGIGMWAIMPESTKWLLSRDRFAEARAAAAFQLGVPEESLPLPTAKPETPPPVKLRELLINPRAFWLIVITWFGMSSTTYGYQLWAPTILSMVMHLPVKSVAGYFVYVSFGGIFGRLLFSYLPVRFGRRHAGEIMGWGSAIFILAAGLFHGDFIGTVPAFVVWLTVASVFVNGGFSNMSPQAAELYPVRLAARAAGLAQGVNGVGKMMGPLFLGLIAGADNLVAPKATEAAVLPAFIFLSLCAVATALAYTLLPIETHGRPLSLKGEAEPPNEPAESPIPAK